MTGVPSPRLVILALVVGLALALPAAWPRPGTGAARSLGAGRPPAQVSATAIGPALPDLTLSWRWDYWFDGCLPRTQPWVLTLRVHNPGAVAAGPFVIQDRRAQWRVPALRRMV